MAVIIGIILLTTAVLAFRDFRNDELIDLKGFAEAYSTYDLLAKRLPAYGYVYPFVELGFGLAMIVIPTSFPLLAAEFVVMAFSGLGVGHARRGLRHGRLGHCDARAGLMAIPARRRA